MNLENNTANILFNIKKILNTENNSINTIGNRPKNLTNYLLPMIQSNYSVSIKADGLRCFLYYEKYIYSIFNTLIAVFQLLGPFDTS